LAVRNLQARDNPCGWDADVFDVEATAEFASGRSQQARFGSHEGDGVVGTNGSAAGFTTVAVQA
jgi:hypothetical protein